MIITSNEYWEEIKSIAANLIEENQEEADERGDCVLEFINDNSLDHLAIIEHSDIAFHAMLADVQEELNSLELEEGAETC